MKRGRRKKKIPRFCEEEYSRRYGVSKGKGTRKITPSVGENSKGYSVEKQNLATGAPTRKVLGKKSGRELCESATLIPLIGKKTGEQRKREGSFGRGEKGQEFDRS